MKSVADGGEDVRVLQDGHSEGAGAVGPEEDRHGGGEGVGGIFTKVFLETGDHGCDGEPESWEEEAFALVGE